MVDKLGPKAELPMHVRTGFSMFTDALAYLWVEQHLYQKDDRRVNNVLREIGRLDTQMIATALDSDLGRSLKKRITSDNFDPRNVIILLLNYVNKVPENAFIGVRERDPSTFGRMVSEFKIGTELALSRRKSLSTQA